LGAVRKLTFFVDARQRRFLADAIDEKDVRISIDAGDIPLIEQDLQNASECPEPSAVVSLVSIDTNWSDVVNRLPDVTTFRI